MKKYILIISIIFVHSTYAIANQELVDKAKKFVKNSEVVKSKKGEVYLKTPKGTIVEVEFNMLGNLDEASGDSVDSDLFAPGEGLLSLSDVLDVLKKQGKNISGEWSFDKKVTGAVYEFDMYEDNVKYEIEVDAKTAEIKNTEKD